MITPHEISTNLQWVTIHGVRQLKMKPAPIYRQLPKFDQSKEGPPFNGVNTKITPEKAVILAEDIKMLDGRIARIQRRIHDCRPLPQDAVHIEELKAHRARIQGERAFIMAQANPKKEPKPMLKKRHMRKSQKPTRKATHETA